jgi:hypothetical protein
MRGSKPRQRFAKSWDCLRRRSSTNHLHYLDCITAPKGRYSVCLPLDDDPVVLDSDAARTDPQLIQVGEQRCRSIKVDLLAVDLQDYHWKSVIAA